MEPSFCCCLFLVGSNLPASKKQGWQKLLYQLIVRVGRFGRLRSRCGQARIEQGSDGALHLNIRISNLDPKGEAGKSGFVVKSEWGDSVN